MVILTGNGFRGCIWVLGLGGKVLKPQNPQGILRALGIFRTLSYVWFGTETGEGQGKSPVRSVWMKSILLPSVAILTPSLFPRLPPLKHYCRYPELPPSGLAWGLLESCA